MSLATRSMVVPFLALGALAACITACLTACVKVSGDAHTASAKVSVTDSWVRSAADTGATTAAYFTLNNEGDAPLVVTKVETAVARATEMHETVTDANNMTSMEPRDSVVVPAHGSVSFKPGGSHVMIIGTNRALTPGDSVPLTLHLSSGLTLPLNAVVRAP